MSGDDSRKMTIDAITSVHCLSAARDGKQWMRARQSGDESRLHNMFRGQNSGSSWKARNETENAESLIGR